MTTDLYAAVGHGRTPDDRHDPGATGDGWTEQTAGDIVVSTLVAEVEAANGRVIGEHNTDDPNFVGTADAANAAQARALVAIHHDSPGAPRGAFAYHHPATVTGDDLAYAIVHELEPITGTRPAWLGPGRGHAHGPVAPRDLHVLRETTMPAVLVECGPIGAYDAPQLAQIGHAIARAAIDFLGGNIMDDHPDTPADDYADRAWHKADQLGVATDDSDPDRTVTDQRLFVFLDRLGLLDLAAERKRRGERVR